MTMYRATWEGSDTSLAVLVSLAQAFQADGTGIRLYCCIDLDMTSDGTNLYTTEAAAFTYAFAAAIHIVSALQPYGVVFYECGNELDGKQNAGWATRVIQSAQGTKPADFSPTVWPILRGVVRGAIAGIRATQFNAIVCSNAFIAASTAASDMLWNGTAPDGSAGYPVCRWDVTAWHNYKAYGDLMNIDPDFGSSITFNLLQYIQTAYGVPIIISEWNDGNGSDTDAQYAAWASQVMYEWYSQRRNLNIAGIIVYELYGAPWAVLNSDGSVLQTFGQTVANFIAANADV